MPKLAINIKDLSMKRFKLYIAIMLSILIHIGLLYSPQHKNTWEIGASELKTGLNTKGMNINLVNQPKPSQKQLVHKVVKDGHKLLAAKVTPTQTSSSSSMASPKIVQKARLQYAPPPIVYPKGAIEQNAIGKVALKAFIDVDGQINNIEIIASSGYKILDDAAIEWFKKLNFIPASDGETNVGSFVSQTISFSLNDIRDS
jgi:TonB family protein